MLDGEVTALTSRATRSVTSVDYHIGNRIHMGRKSRRLTQKALAEKIGISTGQVVKLERAENKTSCQTLYAIAVWLNIQPGWFFEGFAADSAAATEFAPGPDVPADVTVNDLRMAQQIAGLEPAQRRLIASMIDQLTSAAATDAASSPENDEYGEGAGTR